eukprot:CAMPEP_0181224350 /NCGR_PEP_ID=MMETSP1096-20121128/31073_1 /TAXON_ID=156174 ORGANISM="Chrysochromulina ericina, Strain CCMP281" /NCGR_SAMPLE_ID=MMETSP1096 /ASSEMBLY_ACC=CAM_ASM_000453 /LENGTH=99 /DNA_ID=CAMNT_0023317413 /DNA_START=454 /DNA_END=753 /DNA_ORIENTATION=+
MATMSTAHARRVVQRKQKPEKMARRRRCSRRAACESVRPVVNHFLKNGAGWHDEEQSHDEHARLACLSARGAGQLSTPKGRGSLVETRVGGQKRACPAS